MRPTFSSQDYILAIRWFSRSKLQVGDIIVFDSSKYGVCIKRVFKRLPSQKAVLVEGDNPISTSSEDIGPVLYNHITAKFLYHFRK